MWFAIDSCDDVQCFTTPSSAEAAAETALDAERDMADEGWNECVTNIMWGRVLGRVKETMRRDATEDEKVLNSDVEEVVEYGLASDEHAMVIPESMDEELEWILSRPNFWCASVAAVLREGGIGIAKKAEAEQAAVIHWMLKLRANHGDQWQSAMQAEHDRIKKQYEDRKAVATASR